MMEMIDIKKVMADFAPVTDVSYLYGEKSDGGQSKIKKGDLSEIIAKGNAIPAGLTINNHTTPGIWIVSGGETVGLSSYSGVLVNLGIIGSVLCQYLLTKDCMAFRREDGLWHKIAFTVVE